MWGVRVGVFLFCFVLDFDNSNTFVTALYTTLLMHLYMNGIESPEMQCRPHFCHYLHIIRTKEKLEV